VTCGKKKCVDWHRNERKRLRRRGLL